MNDKYSSERKFFHDAILKPFLIQTPILSIFNKSHTWRANKHLWASTSMQNRVFKMLNSSLLKKYPPTRSYQALFLSQFLKQYDNVNIELNESLVNLMLENAKQKDVCEEEYCYQIYPLSLSDSVDEENDDDDEDELDAQSNDFVVVRVAAEKRISTTGLAVWDAALVLTELLLNDESARDLVAGKRVLSLACGTAFVSLALMRKEVEHITVVDYSPPVLLNAMHNLKINGNFDLPENVEATSGDATRNFDSLLIDFVRCDEQDVEQLIEKKPELIVASDVMYDPQLIDAFVSLLQRLLKSVETPPRVLVANTKRSDELSEHFHNALRESQLDFSKLDVSDTDQLFDVQFRENVCIYDITV